MLLEGDYGALLHTLKQQELVSTCTTFNIFTPQSMKVLASPERVGHESSGLKSENRYFFQVFCGVQNGNRNSLVGAHVTLPNYSRALNSQYSFPMRNLQAFASISKNTSLFS